MKMQGPVHLDVSRYGKNSSQGDDEKNAFSEPCNVADDIPATPLAEACTALEQDAGGSQIPGAGQESFSDEIVERWVAVAATEAFCEDARNLDSPFKSLHPSDAAADCGGGQGGGDLLLSTPDGIRDVIDEYLKPAALAPTGGQAGEPVLLTGCGPSFKGPVAASIDSQGQRARQLIAADREDTELLPRGQHLGQQGLDDPDAKAFLGEGWRVMAARRLVCVCAEVRASSPNQMPRRRRTPPSPCSCPQVGNVCCRR